MLIFTLGDFLELVFTLLVISSSSKNFDVIVTYGGKVGMYCKSAH
jgi:hypothetical protein